MSRAAEPLEPALTAPTAASLIKVTAKGDQRKTLEALRDAIAEAMGAASPSEVASLSKQMRDTLQALAALPAPKEASTVDQLAKRRATRRSGADVPPRTASKVNGRTRSGGAGSKRGARTRPVAKTGARGGAG